MTAHFPVTLKVLTFARGTVQVPYHSALSLVKPSDFGFFGSYDLSAGSYFA